MDTTEFTVNFFLLSDGVGVKVIVHGIRSVSRENSVLIPLTTLSFTIKWKLRCRSRKQKPKAPPPPSFLRSQPLGREHVGRKAFAHKITDHVFRSTELGELSL